MGTEGAEIDGGAGGGRFELTPEDFAGAGGRGQSSAQGRAPQGELQLRILGFSAGCGVALAAAGLWVDRLDPGTLLERAPVGLGAWAFLVFGRSSAVASGAPRRARGALGAGACCAIWSAALLGFLGAGAGPGDWAPWIGWPVGVAVLAGALAGAIGAGRGALGSVLALAVAGWAAVGGPGWGEEDAAGGPAFEPFHVVAAELTLMANVSFDLAVGACPPTTIEVEHSGRGSWQIAVPLAVPPSAGAYEVEQALSEDVRLDALGEPPPPSPALTRVLPAIGGPFPAGQAPEGRRALLLGAFAALASAILAGLIRLPPHAVGGASSWRSRMGFLGVAAWAMGAAALPLIASSRGWLRWGEGTAPGEGPRGVLVLEGTRGGGLDVPTWSRVIRRPAPARVVPAAAVTPIIQAVPGGPAAVPSLVAEGGVVRATPGAAAQGSAAVDFIEPAFDPGFRLLDERVNTLAALEACWRRGADGTVEFLGPWALGQPRPAAAAGSAAAPDWVFAGVPLGVPCLAGRMARGQGLARAGAWHPEGLVLEGWVRLVGPSGN